MKILIVDDERMICEWLSYCVEKNEECQLVGIAYNAEQALKMFREFSPDVVISDIKMPVMNGLNLLKIIKEEARETKVVLLTAFAEFELAKSAIALGVDEYLLKTEMSHQAFQQLIHKLKEKGVKGSEFQVKTNFSNQIISDILKEDRILTEAEIKKLREYNIGWRDDGLFALAVWKKDLLANFILPKDNNIRHMAGFEYDNLTYMFVGNIARDLRYSEKTAVLFEYSKKVVAQNHCMVGVSLLTDKLTHVMEVIIEASYGLTQGFYCESYKLWSANLEICAIRKIKENNINMMQNLNKKLYHLKENEFLSFIECELNKIEVERLFPLSEAVKFCLNIMDISYLKFSGNGAHLINLLLQEEKQMIFSCVDFKLMKNDVINLVRTLITPQEFNEKKLSKNVSAAIQYIRNHYQDSISLEIIAENVNLNAEYLSRIFKDETGVTYSTFLTDVRLKKAAHLLNTTNERVKRIAEQVGYPNVSYFSTIFKKKYGLNPYQYRNK